MITRLPVTDDPEVLYQLRRITPWQRHKFMLQQIAAPVGSPPPITHWPRATADRLRLPVMTPHQLKLARMVCDPDGPRVIGVIGGIGVGKTKAGADAITLCAMTRPGSQSLVVGHTQTNLAVNVRPFIEANLAVPRGHPPSYVFDRKDGCYRLSNGSVIWIRHYTIRDNDESKNPIEGASIDGVLFIEEAEQIDRRVLKHALQRARGTSMGLDGRAYQTTIILNGRPAANRWWIKAVRIIGRKMRKRAKKTGKKSRGIAVIVSKTKENPHNPPDYLDGIRDSLSPDEFLAITECKETSSKEAHYRDWRTLNDDGERAYWPHTNIVRAADFAGPGPVTCSFDFGFRSPAVVIYRLVDVVHPRTRETHTLMVILDTIAEDDCTTPQLLELVRQRYEAHGWWQDGLCRGDPAGLSVEAGTGLSAFDRVAMEPGEDELGGGLGAEVERIEGKIRRTVRLGIGRVQGLICNMNGLRRIVATDDLWYRDEDDDESLDLDDVETVRRDLPYTIRAYTPKVSERKRRMNGQDHPSTHIADALRYAVITDLWGTIEQLPPIELVNDTDPDYDAEIEAWLGGR